MVRAFLALLIIPGLALAAPALQEKPKASAGSRKPATKPGAKPKLASLTGCVDQRGPKYVLADDAELKQIAELEGDDPDRASFAKYLGQKVIAYGELSFKGETQVLRVQKIERISTVCAPGPPKR